jgi:predicted RND superfamily exporter protein
LINYCFEKTKTSIMKKYLIILVALFLLSGVFCVKAQTSGTDTVNISALVPQQGGGGFIPPDIH